MELKNFLPEDIREYIDSLNCKRYKKAFEHYCGTLNLSCDEREATEAATQFVELCKERIEKKRFFKKVFCFDTAQFLIFFTLPALMAQNSEYWTAFAETLCRLWNELYPENPIGMRSFEELSSGFGNRIFGFEIHRD